MEAKVRNGHQAASQLSIAERLLLLRADVDRLSLLAGIGHQPAFADNAI
jgi:hypothetical protein